MYKIMEINQWYSMQCIYWENNNNTTNNLADDCDLLFLFVLPVHRDMVYFIVFRVFYYYYPRGFCHHDVGRE